MRILLPLCLLPLPVLGQVTTNDQALDALKPKAPAAAQAAGESDVLTPADTPKRPVVHHTVHHTPPTPTAQTISFGALPASYVGATVTVSATASSGLPVSFSIVPNGNCSISGNVVTFLNTGNCGVVANQAGNSTYAAATSVARSFTAQ